MDEGQNHVKDEESECGSSSSEIKMNGGKIRGAGRMANSSLRRWTTGPSISHEKPNT